MNIPCMLVVDDEPNSLFGMSEILTEEGYKVITAENGKEALKKLETDLIDLIISDEKMPGMNGMELLSTLKTINCQVPFILITGYGSISMAVEALKQGAFYFFEKPIFNSLDQFLAIIRQALKTRQMEKELEFLRKEVGGKYSFPNVIGSHPKMLEIFETIGKVAKTESTVLIEGESGTGKDLIARCIHYNSIRREKPLVTVSCGALTETLLTTELFGHKKGAFTGAVNDTIGRFQVADKGTLLLDEISEVPLHLQGTLLRVIEEKEFERVGESHSKKVDVRIIAISNRNLLTEVSKGNFRQDLFYRLNVVPLVMPPLRERITDVPLLVHHFLRKFKEGDNSIGVAPEVLEYMKKYSWPGNIRELANVVQQMMIFCDANKITADDLPPSILLGEEEAREEGEGRIQLMGMVAEVEKKWILRKLKEKNWNKEKAAEALGITRKILDNRIKKYKIKFPNNRLPGH